jgi:antitoxin component YwqK of YwqJK toxin-antitoxin module
VIVKDKSYFKSGVLKYEGEFKNNKCHGYGIKYNEDGTKDFDGEF